MDSRLQAGMRKLSEKGTKEERRGREASSSSSLCRGLHNSFRHFEQLSQQLEKLQSSVWALGCVLDTVKEIKTEIQTVLANQDLSRQKQADWEQNVCPALWAVTQRLQAASEQSASVDSRLKAVGMTLTMGGAPVTCQDVVKSLTEHVLQMGVILPEKQNTHEHDGSKTVNCNASLHQQEEQEDPTASEAGEESSLEAKKCRLEGPTETKTQREEEHTTQTWRPGDNVLESTDKRQRRRSSLVKKQGEKQVVLVQRMEALIATLKETKKEAEQLNLQEPTMPALQQRYHTITSIHPYINSVSSHPPLLSAGHVP